MMNIYKGIAFSKQMPELDGISQESTPSAYLVCNAYKKYVTLTCTYASGHWSVSITKALTDAMPTGNYDINVLDGNTDAAQMVLFEECFARVLNSAKSSGNTQITAQ